MEKQVLLSYDKKNITVYEWGADNPKALVQFVHDKGDSPLRYKEFFEYLNGRGYLVFALGLRAHFATDESSLGLGYAEIYNDTLKDMALASKLVSEKFDGKKLFLIGQGYGSFLCQSFVERYEKYADALVIGGCFKFGNLGVNRLICTLLHKLKGENYVSKALNRLSFGAHAKSDLLYLSSNFDEIEKYKNDTTVGFDFNCAFYKSYWTGIVQSFKKSNLEKLKSDLKVLISGGEKDVLGGCGKALKNIKQIYDNLGIRGVKLKLYSDAKHDYLLDKSKEEARLDIANFFDEICGGL